MVGSCRGRTTPCLFGLFSIVTLLAGQLGQRARTAVWIDSWYRKSHLTFADALAAVRRQIWRETGLLTSRHRHKTPKILTGPSARLHLRALPRRSIGQSRAQCPFRFAPLEQPHSTNQSVQKL